MKKISYAASVYMGLKDYPKKKNIEYLKLCSSLGIKTIFTSAHIPEAKNIQKELDYLLPTMNEEGMRLIIDVSKPMMEHFQIPECTYALRLDWGFTDEEIIEMSNNLFCNIELNASTISIEKLLSLVSRGLNVSKVRMSYNFYPKPYTGLDIFELKRRNEIFHELGFICMAYIPSLINKRPPLYKGVPSVESHRTKPTYISTQEMILVGMDEIGMGDAYSTEDELMEMNSCTAEAIQLPLILNKDVSLNVLRILNSDHHSRPDQSPYMIRSSTRAKDEIVPENNGKIKKYDVTVDNKKNLRYMGEIGIWLQDIKKNKEANVVGYIPEEGYDLIALLPPGSRFDFLIKGVKND